VLVVSSTPVVEPERGGLGGRKKVGGASTFVMLETKGKVVKILARTMMS